MKYYKKAKTNISRIYILFFILVIIAIIFLTRDVLYRSLVTINLGSVYIELLNEKAEVINYLKNNEIKTVNISMSPNNYVRMQKERSSMVSNYVLKGNQWFGDNNYFKVRYNDGISEDVKAEIKLFGMNPDHFRDSDGHSFRLRFDGKQGFGDKKVNFLNPRSRDFITDPLLNIIYGKLYGGLKINYKPVRVVLNKSNYGIFYMEDFFDKYFIEQNQKRESLIFEISNDSIYYNHLGEDESFLEIGTKLNQMYHNDYDSFIDKFDINKIKALIVLASVINDEHPLSDINMHWYYNNVTGLIEPTIREGFVKKTTSINIDKILANNAIINDIYNKHINSDFLYDMKSNLALIKEIILNDKEYNNLKNKMIGFGKNIDKKENIILENIDILSNQLKNEEKTEEKIVNTIYINKDTTISGNYIVPKNTILKIREGVRIKLKNAYIKVFGEFRAIGTSNKPIIIEGIGRESGTLFFNTEKSIIIQDVIFSNLTNANSGYNQPAAITFYECSSINILNSFFRGNLMGDDYINFFRSNNISIDNATFMNVLYDAIDSDFSQLSMKNSTFEDIGNDAVDGSGSMIDIYDNSFYNVQDKAISAGEESFINISNSIFKLNEIALVSKDASKIISINNLLENNIIDFASYKKKSFFGFPEAVFENTKIKNYLIEDNSIVEGLDTIIYTTNIESKLYGNLYGRASE
tara:strand:- start:2540 stop:4624 length:2085 start_codon:yes stop_codon:yes gene_type:complete